jgi:hypothetical protein
MEFLKGILGDDLYTQLETKLQGNDKIKVGNIADGSYISKGVYDTELSSKKALEEQLTSTDTMLKDFFKDAKGEKLEEKIKDFQGNLKLERENQQKANKELQLQTAIKLATVGKVQDVDILLGLINKEEIILDDKGQIKSGLNEQLEDLQKSKSFLFVKEESNKPEFKGFSPAQSGGNQPNVELDELNLRLKEAREKNNTLEVIKIKQEASNKGISLL